MVPGGSVSDRRGTMPHKTAHRNARHHTALQDNAPHNISAHYATLPNTAAHYDDRSLTRS